MSEAPQSPWQTAKITRIEKRTPRVASFFFALSRPFAYRAGQHVDVRLTAPDGYQARRSYSIASAPESGATIELVIEKLDDGEVSPFFHDIAAVGDEIELRGPLGPFRLVRWGWRAAASGRRRLRRGAADGDGAA